MIKAIIIAIINNNRKIIQQHIFLLVKTGRNSFAKHLILVKHIFLKIAEKHINHYKVSK